MTVYLFLNPAGEATAQKLVKALGGEARSARPDPVAVLQEVFAQGRSIVALMAAGIVIRALASKLTDKTVEPPVLAVAADGSAVVPLLGGHRGANALARRMAEVLGSAPAITTAGDVLHGLALDEPPAGWKVSHPELAKPLMASLAAGGEAAVLETYRNATGFALHPPVLALGVGCERNAAPEELRDLVLATLQAHDLSPLAVACVVSLDLKSDERAVLDLAKTLDVPARFFSADQLEAVADRLHHPSNTVFAEVGCHGVAEGAALAAGGPKSTLLVAKTKSARATCAVALSPHPIDPEQVGRGQGRLFVVGIGPGAAEWRTPEVTAAVTQAEVLVGYGLYLDLLGLDKPREQTALGEEEGRARRALELAAQGKTVALVCSGDAGIYALASLVFELLERGDDPAWSRVAVTVCPGVSALQAAAARAGAPLGHDFCTISLSDLLTPRDVILRRLEAAAQGDFVTAFYNPVSQRRRDLLGEAKTILLRHRPPQTPVVLARNLGRDGETVTIIDLAELEVDQVDMLTLVLVGNSETRRTGRWVYTPRGYAGKHGT
ncbi:MAG: precorrin-3B C(17)-methyltransferase [Alphaproteobacteria bacterium RIFOXYD12_FULL_60_8]|nr:MAG: precorrin-3B C(17)-methyltransferase [Alphaproteobacteria bacterium RIFOXYD12_FULL_60_8]